jgi:predicted secreted acid phosphatase
MERKRIIVDIDETICTLTKGEYAESKPFVGAIKYLNSLSEKGHKIIYYTGRGWDKYEFTSKQLKSWGCQFEQLICGKPLADIYVDDLSVNSALKLEGKMND